MDQVGVGSNPIIHLFRLVVRGRLLPRTTGGIEKEELGRHGKPVPPGDTVGIEARKGAPLAQLAEHLTLNQAVEGSIPSRRNFSVELYGPKGGTHVAHLGRVLELVDRIDLGSIGVTPREGSSPSSPILKPVAREV